MRSLAASIMVLALAGCASSAPGESIPASIEITDVRVRGAEVQVAANVKTSRGTGTRSWGATLADGTRVALVARDAWPEAGVPVCVTERPLEGLALGSPVRHLGARPLAATAEEPLTAADARDAVFVQLVRQDGQPVLRVSRPSGREDGRLVDPARVVVLEPPVEVDCSPEVGSGDQGTLAGPSVGRALEGLGSVIGHAAFALLVIVTMPVWLPVVFMLGGA